ncbi:MAG: LodA/GoxA family CTQ-dependent oxidase [Gammaproteobacteria bacterium]
MRSLKNERAGFNITTSCDNPIEGLTHMFVDMVQKRRVEEQGQCPARRPVFLRTHGIIRGHIVILDDIPADYKQGMFACTGQHPVYVRYSSDLADGRPDWKSTIGIGIKMFDIPGQKVVSDDDANVADLLLQNVPFFFVDTARDMCAFTKASFEGWADEWVQENSPQTNILLDEMAKPIRSVFDTSLWSVVPFKLGDNHYCKYVVRPGTSTFADEVNTDDPDFLRKDLVARMAAGEASLDIFIQKRPDAAEYGEAYLDEHFPLDRATVVWDEKEAPPLKVAQIHLPQQDIANPEQETYGDWLAFNIGRVPQENAPVGSVAEARMVVYKIAADYRRETNGQPLEQPSQPGLPEIKNPVCPFPFQKPAGEQPRELTEDQIKRISHVRIHPGIGVARIGNSQRDFLIGPEVMNPERTAFGSTRDDSGAIKRQAARFRIYAYDKYDNVVAEVQQTANSQVEWSVHVANRKAQWYEFNAAMDIPATVTLSVPLRNPDVKGEGRAALCIDPGEKKISGLSMNDSSYELTGDFQGTPVTLGELRTDSVGRLLFLGGHGVSASPSDQPVYDPAKPSSFNNAAGWYDDISDGPVHAKVTIGNQVFEADSAWVVTGPPNFAPDLVGWRTLDDLLRSVYRQAGMLEMPERISFKQHVLPILQRLNELQWVNKGFLSMFGAGAPMDFSAPELLAKLSKAPLSQLYPDPYAELRRTVYRSFRATNTRTVEESTWPWIYGDAFGYTDPDPTQPPSPNKYLKLPAYYDFVLSTWVSGDFVSDYDAHEQPSQHLDDVPLQEQPEMLDRAALHFCLADAFHPGAELTWPMRHASMYRAPYRIRERRPGESEPSYGSMLNNATVLEMNGPLYKQGPGDLTRWMALPWQGDTAFCRSGYDMEYDPYLPTFWPARVPNQVLTEIDYDTLMDQNESMEVRIAAFQNRPSWLRQLPAADPAPLQMQYMIQYFGQMGVLEARPKPADIDWLPEYLYVENLTAVKRAEQEDAYKLFQANYAKLGPTDRALQEAGWFSEEQRNEFATIKRRGN